MAKPKTYERIAWEDRFNRPTAELLREGLRGPARKCFDRFRRHVLALEAVSEDFAWHGACWRWTIEYRSDLSDEPLAVIVPSPADLQVAVPLERELVRMLSTRRMKRALRDGVGLAQDPFDTRWGVWSIEAEGLLDDITDLLELKLRHQAKQVG